MDSERTTKDMQAMVGGRFRTDGSRRGMGTRGRHMCGGGWRRGTLQVLGPGLQEQQVGLGHFCNREVARPGSPQSHFDVSHGTTCPA